MTLLAKYSKISEPTFTCSNTIWENQNNVCPVNIYLFTYNNGNTRTMCSIYSKLTITTPEWRHGGHFDDFIVSFALISQIALLFLLLTLKKLTLAGLLFAQIINYSLGGVRSWWKYLLVTITLDFSVSITIICFTYIIFTGKTTECSKHWRHNPIEEDILLELNRWIFQISIKYIKLVIPKILFILVLYSFNFYFKITWLHSPLPTKLPPTIQTRPPPPPPKLTFLTPSPPSKDFSEIFNTPPPKLEVRVHALQIDNLNMLIVS